MSRKQRRVEYSLNAKDVKRLPPKEIKAILRGADELIAVGVRSMLAKILKGSKDKTLLEHGLEKCPVYGYHEGMKLEDITARIDWLILHGYLDIEYSGRLPVIAFTDRGWEIERDTYSDELLEKLKMLTISGDYGFVKDLKDRNRGMILLLLDKIKRSGDKSFIPLLAAWREIDYKKVQAEITNVIAHLEMSSKVVNLQEYRLGKDQE